MSNWKFLPLSEIAEIRVSSVDKKSKVGEKPVQLCNYMDVYANEYITTNLEFMQSTANSVEVEKFRVCCGDVIITKDSETPYDIGIPAVVMDDITGLVCGYHLALIKPDKTKINSVYLAKQMASNYTASYFSRMAAGSTRYGLSNRAIAAVTISLAPKKQQKKIATILTIIDQTIGKTEALIHKYQQIKAGLMHDLFTRGVTADGKLRPPKEQAPQLYKETPIGWIPKEWKVDNICNLFHIQLGKMLSRAAETGKWSASYLGNKNVQWDKVDLLNLEQMDFTPAEREKYKLIYHDLLVCEGGDVGRTSMWRGEMDVCFYQKAIHRLRPKDERIAPALMLRFMFYAKQIGAFTDFTSQTSIAHLTQEQLGKVKVLIPTMDEQSLMIERFDDIDNKINAEAAYFEKLIVQKSGLMHDLLTGKVPVTIDPEETAHGS